MAIPPDQIPSAFSETVNEIMRIYRSLPPRPTIEEIEAAMAVLKTADNEEQLRIEEINRLKKPIDVPEELFYVLQEVKKNEVLLQTHEQRKEALYLIDLDKQFQTFDDLIQRASRLVSGDTQDDIEVDSGVLNSKSVKKSYVGDESQITKWRDQREVSDAPKGLVHSYSLRGSLPSGGDAEKLSLIKVASLIEVSAKSGVGVLDLQGKLMDQMEWLPVSLGKLSDVTDLNLSENRIMALPPTMNSLKSLTRLDVHSNQLINLPDSFGELSNLINLDLRGNRLKSLPTSFGNLTSLTNLDLSSNQLSQLPDTLGNLTSLKILSVDTNELEELPFTIGLCSSLVELRVDFNRIKALPEAIGKLENLEILTLHYNRIKGLPTTMGSLLKLKELDVSFNEIESVPESFCFATSLVKLNLGRNFADLRALPRSIGNLEMLEELDIGSNQIRILPDSFRLLSKLRVLCVDETPLEVPPMHIAKLGAQAVVQYMADLVKVRETPQPAMKKDSFWFCICCLCWPSQKKYNKSKEYTK